MAAVTLENLSKFYPEKSGADVRAVHGVSLEIKSGEFMVLVGPSGCGKSTTLRMIAGLEEISAGRITIDGVEVNDVAPKDRDIAMVFQNYALYPHMSVYENMAFGLKLRKFPKPEIDQRVREAAAMLGLETLLDRKPKALSGGQRQRVALGRAIVRKPKVFLFDEPLSNLDAKMRVTTRADISKLHARLGVTMIYVTHDQTEAMTMADRICVMKDGAIMQVAEPLELYNRPANQFVAGFIGSPPMNFFRGQLGSENGQARFTEESTRATPLAVALNGSAPSAPAGPVVLGLRPEDIEVSGDGATEATVEIAEPMGPETYLHLSTGATNFVVRARPSHVFKPGEKIRVQLNLERARWFDAGSGISL